MNYPGDVRIEKARLNQPFEPPCESAAFVLLRLPSDSQASTWFLADLRTPAGRALLPPHGSICSWMELTNLDQYLQIHPLPVNLPAYASDSISADLHLRELCREFSNASDDREARLPLLLGLVLLDFRRTSGAACAAPAPLSAKADDRLAPVIRRMLTEYRHPWRVEELSGLLDVSPSYLNRLCRRRYGMSPIDMLIDHRISIAKRCLLLPGARVSDVCESVGFSDVYYFSRAFKKRCGVTPTEYMKKPCTTE